MLESHFNKVASLRPETFLKETPTQVFSCECYEIFKNTYFERNCERLLLYSISESTFGTVRSRSSLFIIENFRFKRSMDAFFMNYSITG